MIVIVIVLIGFSVAFWHIIRLGVMFGCITYLDVDPLGYYCWICIEFDEYENGI